MSVNVSSFTGDNRMQINQDGPLAPLGLSVESAATVSGIGRTNLFRAIKDGRLPAHKYGRRTVILTSDLEEFLRNLPIREVA